MIKIARLVLLCGLLCLSAGSPAQERSVLRDAGSVPVELAGGEDREQVKVFIVQLRSPSAAERQATLIQKLLAAPMALKPRARFDKNSPSVKAWVAEIEVEQQRVLGKAGPGAEKIYSYRYGMNGFAARMSIAQAQKLEHDDDVLNVWEDEIRPMATNYSPVFLGLFDAEDGLRSAEGLDGDGIVIGVIDSGIAPEHPALRDTREADRPRLCRSSWAEATLLGKWLCRRYRKMADVLVCLTSPKTGAEPASQASASRRRTATTN